MKLSLQKKKTYLRIKKKKKNQGFEASFFKELLGRERERFAQTENTVTFRNKQRVGVKVVINTPRVSTRQSIAANWFVYMRKMLPHQRYCAFFFPPNACSLFMGSYWAFGLYSDPILLAFLNSNFTINGNHFLAPNLPLHHSFINKKGNKKPLFCFSWTDFFF